MDKKHKIHKKTVIYLYKITYFIQYFIQQYMNYINKYKLNQCIGKGSFGEIYHATNTITNE